TSTITNGTNFGKQIQVANTSTFQGAVSTTIANALWTSGSNGVLAGYAATSCAAGTAFTGLSASGTPTCSAFGSSNLATTTSYSSGFIPVVSSSLALTNSIMSQAGTTLTVNSTQPSTTVN